MRTHNRGHFYKFATHETALKVIESRSFRWSAPTKFNDPFDHQVGFVLDESHSQFGRAFESQLVRAIFGEEAPAIKDSTAALGQMALELRRTWKLRHRYAQRELLRVIENEAAKVAGRLISGVQQLNENLRQNLLHCRVFCVSEQNDNVVMWSHYADQHRGVAFKLRCVDELDNRLLVARPVEYQRAFLPFPSPVAYSRHLLGIEPIDMAANAWKMALTKQEDWGYEKEWRVHHMLLDAPAGDGYSLYEEPAEVFEAIYVGCRMSDEKLAELSDAVAAHLPHVDMFRAVLSERAFELRFHLIRWGRGR